MPGQDAVTPAEGGSRYCRKDTWLLSCLFYKADVNDELTDWRSVKQECDREPLCDGVNKYWTSDLWHISSSGTAPGCDETLRDGYGTDASAFYKEGTAAWDLYTRDGSPRGGRVGEPVAVRETRVFGEEKFTNISLEMRPSKSKNTDENVHGLKPTHGQSRGRFVTKETDVRSFPSSFDPLLLFSVTAKRKKPSARARRGADQRASRRSRARDRRSPAERPPTRTMVRPRPGVVPARGRSSCPRRAFSGQMRRRPPGSVRARSRISPTRALV